MSFASFMKNQKTVITTSQSNSTSTNFADVTGMGMPMMANTIYQFQFDIIYQSTNTNTGIGFGVNGPAGPIYVIVRTEIPPSLTVVTQGLQRAYDTGTASATTDAANVNTYAKCYGYVSNGNTAGNLILRFKSESGNQVSVMPNTIGKMWRISPSN